MDAGTLLWILLIGGGVFAMFFMHRGGHAHGGGGCGGHGHDHGTTSIDESPETKGDEAKPRRATESHDHDREPVGAGNHRGR